MASPQLLPCGIRDVRRGPSIVIFQSHVPDGPRVRREQFHDVREALLAARWAAVESYAPRRRRRTCPSSSKIWTTVHDLDLSSPLDVRPCTRPRLWRSRRCSHIQDLLPTWRSPSSRHLANAATYPHHTPPRNDPWAARAGPRSTWGGACLREIQPDSRMRRAPYGGGSSSLLFYGI